MDFRDAITRSASPHSIYTDDAISVSVINVEPTDGVDTYDLDSDLGPSCPGVYDVDDQLDRSSYGDSDIYDEYITEPRLPQTPVPPKKPKPRSKAKKLRRCLGISFLFVFLITVAAYMITRVTNGEDFITSTQTSQNRTTAVYTALYITTTHENLDAG